MSSIVKMSLFENVYIPRIHTICLSVKGPVAQLGRASGF